MLLLTNDGVLKAIHHAPLRRTLPSRKQRVLVLCRRQYVFVRFKNHVNTFVCGVYEYVCNRVHVTEFLVTDWVIRTAGEGSLLRSGWLRGPAVEHWFLADVLSLSCARLVADW